MGNIFNKDPEDMTTRLTGKDRRLIRDSWHAFKTEHEDYGVILFTSLFVKHPEYQQLFKNFREKKLGALKMDPKFSAHASTVGHQITVMVNSLDTPRTLLEIIGKNAELHMQKSGVAPEHFVELGRVIIEVLCANQEELMPPAVVKAWEKLFRLMNEQTAAVFADEPRPVNAKSADSYKVEHGMSTAHILSRSNTPAERAQNRRLSPRISPLMSKRSSPRASPLSVSPTAHVQPQAASEDKVIGPSAASDDPKQGQPSAVPPRDQPKAHRKSRTLEKSSHRKGGKDHVGHEPPFTASPGSL